MEIIVEITKAVFGWIILHWDWSIIFSASAIIISLVSLSFSRKEIASKDEFRTFEQLQDGVEKLEKIYWTKSYTLTKLMLFNKKIGDTSLENIETIQRQLSLVDKEIALLKKVLNLDALPFNAKDLVVINSSIQGILTSTEVFQSKLDLIIGEYEPLLIKNNDTKGEK